MKIPLSAYCNYCEEEAKKRGEKYLEGLPSPTIFVELNENGIYSWNCAKNHENWIFLQEHLFQVLFDLGILSLSDGYTREATNIKRIF